jgi:RNA polymerase sigma factor (TIGR02999 family)
VSVAEQPTPNLTELLNDAGRGDPAAREALWRAIYGDVHAIAARTCAAEGLRRDLQPTLLVHEVFLKMFGSSAGMPPWENRRHFWGSVGRAMGQILVDLARSEDTQHRGGGRQRVALDLAAGELTDASRACSPMAAEVVDALDRLEAHSPESAHVARLRYLAGLSVEETAALLGIAPRTVTNRWTYARTWLRRAIAAHDSRMEADG